MTEHETERRTLREHIREALHVLADRQRLRQHRAPDGDRPDLVETWLEDARTRVVVGLEVDRRRGRVDHRSLSVTAMLPLRDGNVVRLGRWRVRDLVDQAGQRIDTAATVRDLVAQHGPIPDDLEPILSEWDSSGPATME